MADTPKEGETVVQEPPKNDVTPVAAPEPQVNSNDSSELDKLKAELKEANQKAMRVGQVENELKRIKDAQEADQRKQLEDQEQWKEVAEQEKAKREELEKGNQDRETQEALRISKEAIFAEFSPEAIEVAEEAGLTLSEDTDDAKATLKSKLEKISQKVITGNKVTPNNPGAEVQPDDRAQKVQAMRAGNTKARDEVIGSLKSLDAMRAQAGYTPEK